MTHYRHYLHDFRDLFLKIEPIYYTCFLWCRIIRFIIHRRLIDAKRTAIARRAKQAKASVRKHTSRSGTAKDLLADLNG